jgi:hypothetical protein
MTARSATIQTPDARVRLLRGNSATTERPLPPAREPTAPQSPAPKRLRNPIGSMVLRLAPAVLGAVAWWIAAANLRLPENGLYGLLAVIGPWYFVALGLIVLGFIAEIFRMKPSGWVLGVHLFALVVAIHGTVPLAAGTPEYAWVYKHLGVVEMFAANGRVIDHEDIYQQWPGLFAAVAAITKLSDVEVVRFAAWAPVVFQLLNCVLLLAVFRSLTRNIRVCFVAVALYVCAVSWVGQDYLSPQAFAYVLWLGLMLIVLRWLRAQPRPISSGEAARLRLRPWRDMPTVSGAPTRRWPAVIAACAVFAVIVVSHQLTPYMALAGIAGLTIVGVIRPRGLVFLLAAIALGFLATRYHLVSSQFGGLFSDGDVVQNAAGKSSDGWHSSAQLVNALLARTVAIGLWAAALLVAIMNRRSLGRVLIPLILAFAPFAVLLAQSYGGEAIYRVFLFSAPWCAFIVASVLEMSWRPVRTALVCIVLVASLFASLQDLYGQVAINVFSRSELAASDWLYRHAPTNSTFLLASTDFPALQTARYADFRVETLPSDPRMGDSWLDMSDEPMLERWAATFRPRPVYLVVSRTMENYARYFGFPNGLSGLRRNVESSRRWQPVYRNASTSIFRLIDA